jgi:hypothetical protein
MVGVPHELKVSLYAHDLSGVDAVKLLDNLHPAESVYSPASASLAQSCPVLSVTNLDVVQYWEEARVAQLHIHHLHGDLKSPKHRGQACALKVFPSLLISNPSLLPTHLGNVL